MMRLAHEILEDDLVFISVPGRAMSCHISASEARRFAWALLADLDPAEADDMGYVAPVIVIANGERREGGGRRGAWQQMEVLECLRDGRNTCTKIANRLALSVNQVSVQLNRLMKNGHARKLTIGVPHRPGEWSITDRGLAELAALIALQEAA